MYDVEAPLATLLWTTLAFAALGFVSTLVVASRHDGRASVLLLLFTALLAHLGPTAIDPPSASIEMDAAGREAIALLFVALGGLAGLAALARVGRERNDAEEMHWNAMETLRATNELTLPGAPDDPLGALLALGTSRFDLPYGAVLVEGRFAPAKLHLPPEADVDVDALASALHRYAERSAQRPFVDDAPDPDLPLPFGRVFLSTIFQDGRAVGHLVFASTSPRKNKLTATDKDLLALLAHGAARLIAVPTGEATPATPPPAPTLSDRLRDRLAGDPVELALEPDLDDAPTSEIPLEDIAYGLASGARRVSSAGTLRVESSRIESPQGGNHFITLTVRIDDPALDASVLNGATSSDGAFLEALGVRLRKHGGDVSMSVESGVGASMTAFVPIRPAGAKRAPDPRPHYAS